MVNTDDFSIYTHQIEERGYGHRVTPRYNGEKIFATGDVHINHAENRFSFLKNWYRRFRGLSNKYLGLWINFCLILSVFQVVVDRLFEAPVLNFVVKGEGKVLFSLQEVYVENWKKNLSDIHLLHPPALVMDPLLPVSV